MGETLASTLCGKPVNYNPGIWFNSAKFFNTEYQVYGEINPTLPDDQRTLYWQHPELKKSIRINYTDQAVIGFNLMGVRFRQAVCEKWITAKTDIESVLACLELALFDQEFSPNYAQHIREVFQSITGVSVIPRENRNYNRVFSFLKNHQTSSL